MRSRAKESAILAARTSKHECFKVGASLVVGGKILSNCNLPAYPGKKMCAETRLLRSLPRIAVHGGVLYVTRVLRRDGTLSMARPCSTCQAWIKSRKIKEVWYTDWNGEWARMPT